MRCAGKCRYCRHTSRRYRFRYTVRGASSSGYPQQAPDEALCNQYNADSASGIFRRWPRRCRWRAVPPSPVLAHNIMNVVNNPGSLSQDEHNMIDVAMDCGELYADKPPVELNK